MQLGGDSRGEERVEGLLPNWRTIGLSKSKGGEEGKGVTAEGKKKKRVCLKGKGEAKGVFEGRNRGCV